MKARAVVAALLLWAGIAEAKSVVTSSDLSYVGSFQLPTSAGGYDYTYSRGLALRWVSGVRKFYAWSVADELGEFSDPGTATSAPWPTATGLHAWNNAEGTVYPQVDDTNGSKKLIGLYWDTTDSRMYFAYGETYCAGGCPVTDPSMGYLTINDGAGTVAGHNVTWSVGGNLKQAMGGVVGIPQAWANTYTGGKRLGIGFGGNWSSHSSGPVSSGPALRAFAPPSSEAQGTNLTNTLLLAYPWATSDYVSNPAYGRMHRDTNYTAGDIISGSTTDSWPVTNGVGFYTSQDYLGPQSCAWIDSANKEGFLCAVNLGTGNVWYQSSEIHAEGASHSIVVYDPADLGAVALGTKQSYEIQPAQSWAIQYPTITYPIARQQDGLPFYWITGTVWDPTDNRLYVAVQWGFDPWSGGGTHNTAVHVYALNDTPGGGSTPPASTPIGAGAVRGAWR